MLEARLKAEDRVPDARYVGTGCISGRRLAFHKASHDGSGKCDIPDAGDASSTVYGVLYEVPDDLTNLDKAEGAGKGYERTTMDVLREDGTSVTAIVYIATKTQQKLAPYTWYHDYVVAGAREHNLPADYIAQLKAVVATADPNKNRETRERQILDASSRGTKHSG